MILVHFLYCLIEIGFFFFYRFRVCLDLVSEDLQATLFQISLFNHFLSVLFPAFLTVRLFGCPAARVIHKED